MPSYNSSRLASVAIAAILILFAFLAILSANSLAWPLSLQGGNTNNSHGPPTPPTGQLSVQASLSQSSGFIVNGTTIINSQLSSFQPLSGVIVSIFGANQRPPLASGQTDSFGSLVLNLTQGLYTMQLNTHYSNLSAQVRIITGQVTYFSLNVNQTQHIASFYDFSDMEFIGQVLPSETVYDEINVAQGQINTSEPVDLATYNYPPITYPVGVIILNSSCPCNGTFSLSTQSFFQVQVQLVPATIVSISESSANDSLWVEVRPNSPLNTVGVQYVGLEQFLTTYRITNSSSGVPSIV